MRYVGQAYEINVAIRNSDLDSEHLNSSALLQAFHAEHQKLYGQCSPKEPVEIVSYRVGAINIVDKAVLAPPESRGQGAPKPRTHRNILLDGKTGWQECPVFDRATLAANDRIPGPAIIEDRGSCFVLRTLHVLNVDEIGNIFVTVPPGSSRHHVPT
jgi:N-methylhydantoinase A